MVSADSPSLNDSKFALDILKSTLEHLSLDIKSRGEALVLMKEYLNKWTSDQIKKAFLPQEDVQELVINLSDDDDELLPVNRSWADVASTKPMLGSCSLASSSCQSIPSGPTSPAAPSANSSVSNGGRRRRKKGKQAEVIATQPQSGRLFPSIAHGISQTRSILGTDNFSEALHSLYKTMLSKKLVKSDVISLLALISDLLQSPLISSVDLPLKMVRCVVEKGEFGFELCVESGSMLLLLIRTSERNLVEHVHLLAYFFARFTAINYANDEITRRIMDEFLKAKILETIQARLPEADMTLLDAALEMMRNLTEFVSLKYIDVPVTEPKQQSKLLDRIKATEYTGVLRALNRYFRTMDSDSIPIELFRSALNLFYTLNSFALVDLKGLQSSLGSGPLSDCLYQLTTFLLEYLYKRPKNSAEPKLMTTLLHQIILFLGYFCVDNPVNQKFLRCGQHKIILKQLARLPIEFFVRQALQDVLLPTLICACQDQSNRMLLRQDISLKHLIKFINYKKAKHYQSGRMELEMRFPETQWDGMQRTLEQMLATKS